MPLIHRNDIFFYKFDQGKRIFYLQAQFQSQPNNSFSTLDSNPKSGIKYLNQNAF